MTDRSRDRIWVRVGTIAAVLSAIFAYVTIGGVQGIREFVAPNRIVDPIKCNANAQDFEEWSNDEALTTPSDVRIASAPSKDNPGMVAAAISWTGEDSDKITGYYVQFIGRRTLPADGEHDINFSPTTRAPHAGDCGKWIRYVGAEPTRASDGRLSIITELWPRELYCVVIQAASDNGSARSEPECMLISWKDDWGQAAIPDEWIVYGS